MSLPPALAARLAKRGIKVNQPKKEEVFAENRREPQKRILDEFGQILPPDWEKAWDSGYETWYYWNVKTQKVSWLNPDDPESEITDPADKQRSSGGGDFGQLRSSRPGRDVDLRTKQKESKSSQGYRGKRRKEEEEDDGEGFDPMDPSSYSDAPKGSWSRGIPKPGESRSTAGIPQVEL